jgi:Spi protease inhibitor
MRNLSLFRLLLCSALVTVIACDGGEVEGIAAQVDGQGAVLDESAPAAATETDPAALAKANLISAAEATRLAEDFAAETFGRAGRPVVVSTRIKRDGVTGDPTRYAFNFQGGGFVLVAADSRQGPVLGFDEVEDFEAFDEVKDFEAFDEVKDFEAFDEVKDFEAFDEVEDLEAFDEVKDFEAVGGR